MRSVALIFLTAVLYFLAARLGYYLTFSHTIVVPLFAPAGIALALMVRFDARLVAAGIFLGSIISSFYSVWNTAALSIAVRVILITLVAAGRTFEGFVGYRMIRALIPSEIYSAQRNVFRFLFTAIVISFIGSGVMISAFKVFEVTTPVISWRLYFNYSLGNLVGILLFTPLIMLLTNGSYRIPNKSALKDFSVFMALVFLVVLLLQIETVAYPLIHALPFIVVPYLLWLASRYNPVIAFSGVFLTAIFALYYTVVVRQGPFIIPGSGDYSMLYLQVFIAVISFSTLLLGAATQERKLAQRNLRDLNENLEQMVQQRTSELMKRNAELDNFVYRVSHDLRAPIASILGLINIAAQDKESVTQYLEFIRKSALRQDQFIREILDHAKNSRSETLPQEVYFSQVVDEVWSHIQPADIPVIKKFYIRQEEPFVSDVWRLKVIFNNILSNAIRYRRENRVEVHINGTITHAMAMITIEDKGQGIPKAHVDKVFDMFYRANENSSGSGLGLYIVKETVAKLGGEIELQSVVNSGTRITLKLPALQTV